MMKSQPIPTFIIEEHHEAFIVWNYAIQQGIVPAAGNTLFHVDEHSDMGTPRFNESIHNLNGDINKVKGFSYSELNIGGFIIPACYKKIFENVYWIKQSHTKNRHRPVKMYVRSYNQGGKRLITGKIKDLKDIPEDIDRVQFDFYHRIINKIPLNKKVILDIDLDYFSCAGNPFELDEIYIEITKGEFDSFTQNKYHRLNFYNNGRIEAIKQNNRFYYRLNYYNEIYSSDCKVTEEQILYRIKKFITELKGKKIEPLIIDICRSYYSGYTPKEQVKFIQKNLLKGLRELYSINITDIKYL